MAWRIRDCIVGRSSIILSGSGFNIIIIIIIIITTATAWAIIIIIVTISITTTTTITTAGRCSWGGGGGGKGPGEVSETNPSTAAPGANLKVPQGERPESDHLSLKNWRATIPMYPRTGGLSLLGMANGANHPVQHGSMAQSEGIDLPEG